MNDKEKKKALKNWEKNYFKAKNNFEQGKIKIQEYTDILSKLEEQLNKIEENFN